MPQLTGNEFLDRLLEQTPASAAQPRRGQNYNYPTRLYLKPDGTVVALQGDPGSRAYYQDKGFHMLSDNATRGGPSEVEQYQKVEYPKLLKEQREKAELINAIRKTAERNPDMHLEVTFDDYSIDDIREYLAEIKRDTGHDIRVIKPRRQREREAQDESRLLVGVQTADSQSLEGLQAAIERSNGGESGAGYDPLEQARKPRRHST